MSSISPTKPPVTGTTTSGKIADELRALLGEAHVETELEKRTFFATDLSRRGPAAAAVVRPGNVEQVAVAVKHCTARGVPVIPRGGGFSYTGGYVPEQADSVIVDLRGLDRIVEINADDMYVVVETGCTWQRLYEALKAKGLRTPYFGPMSGYHATVGGALSQGSFFLGSSQYGPVADSVLAIEIVLADGTVLRTGSWGGTTGSPFFRSYGPDLTGLFLGDTGALGFKTKAVIKLIPFPAAQGYASFAFDNEGSAVAALSAISRTGIAGECYCWDPYFVKVMASASTGLAEDLKFLAGVARGGSGSKVRGLFNAARLAAAGKSSFDGDIYMLNLTVDDPTRAGADARVALLKQIASAAGGREMTASAPMAMRGTPFIDFNTPDRRRPMRNLPTHGLVPHSVFPAISREIRALFDRHRPALEQAGVEIGVVYFGVGMQAVCAEPLFYWDDHEHFQHDRITERSDLAALEAQQTPVATGLVTEVRKELVAIYTKYDSAHVQIGKSYPWLTTRSEAVRTLVTALKRAVDPDRLVNPGSLGL